MPNPFLLLTVTLLGGGGACLRNLEMLVGRPTCTRKLLVGLETRQDPSLDLLLIRKNISAKRLRILVVCVLAPVGAIFWGQIQVTKKDKAVQIFMLI